VALDDSVWASKSHLVFEATDIHSLAIFHDRGVVEAVDGELRGVAVSCLFFDVLV